MVPLSPPWRALRSCAIGATAFTLLELTVVAAILVLVSAASFPSLVRIYEEQKLRYAAIELQSHLQRGRTLAQRLQGKCSVSLVNSSDVLVSITPAVSATEINVCASSYLSARNLSALRLSTLNLSQLTGVRGLALTSTITPPTGSATSSTCPSATPCSVVFNGLGVMVGDPQTLFLSGTGTTSQFCVDLSLTLIRVGFRNSGSGACTYSRS